MVGEIQIYQVPNKPVPGSADLFLLSDEGIPGHIVKNTTVAQLSAAIQAAIVPKSNVRYISPQGSDTLGTGTEDNPWATLSYALSQITDSNDNNPYLIKFDPAGHFVETDLALKNSVWYDLQGAQLTVANLVTLDSSWNDASGSINFQNAQSLNLSAGMNLDFNANGSPFAVVNFFNVRVDVGSTYVINGNANGSTILTLNGFYGFSSAASFEIYNCYGGGGLGNLLNLSVIHTSDTTGSSFNLSDLVILGEFIVSDNTSVGINLFLTGVKATASTLFQSLSGSPFNIFSRASIYFSGPTCDGVGVLFNPDTLTQLPNLINGATFSPSSIADGVSSNSTFVNFTPTNSSVKGALEGVDAALTAAASEIRYVSVNGSDSANGSILSPWATVTYALSQVTSSSVTPVTIKLLSDVTDNAIISLKPFVSFDLSGFTLSVDQIALSADWDTAFSETINFYMTHGVLKLTNPSVFDFTPYLAQSAFLSFFDLKITQSLEFIGNGAQVVNLKDVGNTAEPLNVKIQDFTGSAISGGLIGNLDVVNTSVPDGMTIFIIAEVVTGNISLTSVVNPLVGFALGAFTFSQIFGDGPQVVIYTSTTLTQRPSMTNGSHWYPIQLNTLSNTLYVTEFGSDEQGDGTSANSYKTITGALASSRIGNATPENPVDIILFGKSNDAGIVSLPPNINITGFGLASTPQYVELSSTAWQSAPPNSQNSITGVNSPGYFLNCVSPSSPPILKLKDVIFSVGYFTNGTLYKTNVTTILNGATSNLITYNNLQTFIESSSFDETEFLCQSSDIHYYNSDFSTNLFTVQGTTGIEYKNCGYKGVTINAQDDSTIRADNTFLATLNLSGNAQLIPIGDSISQSAAINIDSSFDLKLPLSIHLVIRMFGAGEIVKLPKCNFNGIPTISIGKRVYVETSVDSVAYEIQYQDGASFRTVSPGTNFYLVVNDNSTENGEWDVINDVSGGTTGTNESYAVAIFNQDIAGSSTSGAIAFSDLTTYLPLITFTAPATYSLENYFSVENDGNLHTILRCQDPAGGTYLLTFNLVLRLINYNSQQSFFMNFGLNGFSSANVDPKKDFPLQLYGTVDKAQIPVNYTCLVRCAFNDVLYAPVIRSGGSTSAFDTDLKALYWQVAVVKCAPVQPTLSYVASTSATVSMQTNRVYMNSYNGGQAVFTAPVSPTSGDRIGVYGVSGASVAGWKINANVGQKFQLGSIVGSSGGSITSGNFGDGFDAVYDAAGTWVVISSTGPILTIL